MVDTFDPKWPQIIWKVVFVFQKKKPTGVSFSPFVKNGDKIHEPHWVGESPRDSSGSTKPWAWALEIAMEALQLVSVLFCFFKWKILDSHS